VVQRGEKGVRCPQATAPTFDIHGSVPSMIESIRNRGACATDPSRFLQVAECSTHSRRTSSDTLLIQAALFSSAQRSGGTGNYIDDRKWHRVVSYCMDRDKIEPITFLQPTS
jgi:hypothetical protein